MKLHVPIPIWNVSTVAIVLLLTISTIPKSNGIVKKGAFPAKLKACYENYNGVNLQNVVGESLVWHCDSTAIANIRPKRVKKTRSSESYVSGLYNKVTASRHRNKRQAIPKCRRREYRMLSDAERNIFHNAINTLKNDTTVTPNKFDALARIHTGAVDTAHGGPNFLGWHRVYILMYEIALQEVDPSICLPYWDSSLDNELDSPWESHIFSNDFLGGGDLTDGPFAGWQTPDDGPLMRNLGGDGELYQIAGIEDILSRERTHEIIPPNAEPQYDLEFQHGGVHVFIGGHMLQLQTSSFDPVFWVHHSFVDYLWELFRTKQRALRINPEVDYPEDFGSELHRFNMSMGFGLGLTAEQGYNNTLTESYEYEPSPDCSSRRRNCGSKYLRCNVTRGRCVPVDPRMVRPDPPTPGPRTTPSPLNPNPRPTPGNPWPNPRPTPGNPWPNPRPTPGNPWPNPRPTPGNPWAHPRPNPRNPWAHPRPTPGSPWPRPGPVNPNPGPVLPVDPPNDPWLNPHPTCKKQKQKIFPIQNTYCLDGVCDTSGWVFVPVKVVSMRPPGMTSYGSYPVKNGHVMKSNDIYKDSSYSGTNLFINSIKGSPKGYQRCDDQQGFSQIFVQSTGINYDGFYKESAIIDQRLATSLAVAYVAVKNPKFGKVTALFRAFDSCGRICHTACKVPGTDAYETCSGVLDIEDIRGQPKQYSSNYGQATLDTWGYAKNKDCPKFLVDDITLTFYCDYRDHITWVDRKPSQLKPMRPMRPMRPIPPVHIPVRHNECIIDETCTIEVPCSLGKNRCSVYGETHKCRNSCNRYAVCNYGRYWTRTCPARMSFNDQWHTCTNRQLCWNSRSRRPHLPSPSRWGNTRNSYMARIGGKILGGIGSMIG